ncbi:bifunctional pyr operon transcriptional regulator/uracil phosphoribosyltransferase PyrR [soil metagenome]
MTERLAPDAMAAYAALHEGVKSGIQASGASLANAALIGIHTGGAWLAEALAADLGIRDLGFLDISFYRDDFSRIGLHPSVRPTDIPFSIDDREIILIDDVLHSGRTIRAAMNALFDWGRPSRIALGVLVDRHGPDDHARELPIAPTWAGVRFELPDDSNVVLSRDGGRFALAIEPRKVRP